MKNENKKSLHFLAYLSRSGSTLLATRLNEYVDIGVGIEENISKHVKDNFIANSDEELIYWIDRVYQSSKFELWGIEKQEIILNLRKYSLPISFADFIYEALSIFFRNDNKKILIHKNNYFFREIRKSKILFPDSKFIFIDRDPRAIYNSQSVSVKSTIDRTMSTDISMFAIKYKFNQFLLRNYINNSMLQQKLLIIKYEEFIENEDFIIGKVLSFLNGSDEKIISSNYYDKIPKSQKHLHENINAGFIKNRIDAWVAELHPIEIAFLNRVLKTEILDNGYLIKSDRELSYKQEIVINIKKNSFYIRYYIKILLYYLKFFMEK